MSQKIAFLTSVIWLALTLGTIGLLGAKSHWEPAAWQHWLVFPAFALGFALTEVFVVHLRVKADAHTYSLVELPLTFGLFFADPLILLAAHLTGAGVALVFHRKQRGLKLAFNLGVFGLTTVAAIAVFRLLDPRPGALDHTEFLAGAAGLLTESIIATLLVFAVISISARSWRLQDLYSGLVFGVTTASFTISLAIIGVIVADARPMMSWLMVVPLIGIYLASWAYTTQRRRNEALDFLYQSTRLLHESAELDAAVSALLEHACTTFNAGAAELIYRAEPGDPPMRVSVGEHANRDNSPADVDHDALIDLFDRLGAIVVANDDRGPAGEFIRARGYRNAVMAPLRIGHHALGVLVIADRLTDVVTFGSTDAVLAGTLANQTATALKNGRLEQSLDQLRVLEQQMTFQALHDPLTGLANRTLLKTEVALAIEEGEASTGSVLFIDLDDFKTVNDSYGHAAGDALLIEVALRLAACVEAEDTVARLGGDEFAVLLPHVTRPDAAMRVADRILAAFEAPAPVGERRLGIRASIGIAMISPGADPDALMRGADTAMYTAKAQGKHRTVLFDPVMYESTLREFNLRSDLEVALAISQLSVFFQPIVSLSEQRVLGAEALVRWPHPQLGLLAPADFLPVAEQGGMLPAVDLFVFESACAFLTAADASHPGLVPWVNINFSPATLEMPGLADRILATLARHRLDPERLGIEVIEELVSSKVGVLLGTLERLRSAGMRLSLDDFGTGYSSLSHLHSLPIDTVKIAKQFIDGVASAPSQQAFTTAIVALCRALDKSVVAEGVETLDQLELLRAIGCDAAQGFLFARPAVGHQFLEWATAFSAPAVLDEIRERRATLRHLRPVGGRTGSLTVVANGA